MKDIEKCCGNCESCYDIDYDGAAKCDKAHGAITHVNNVCKAWS